MCRSSHVSSPRGRLVRGELPGRCQRRKPAVWRIHQHRRPVRPGAPVKPEVVVGAHVAPRPGFAAPPRARPCASRAAVSLRISATSSSLSVLSSLIPDPVAPSAWPPDDVQMPWRSGSPPGRGLHRGTVPAAGDIARTEATDTKARTASTRSCRALIWYLLRHGSDGRCLTPLFPCGPAHGWATGRRSSLAPSSLGRPHRLTDRCRRLAGGPHTRGRFVVNLPIGLMGCDEGIRARCRARPSRPADATDPRCRDRSRPGSASSPAP